MPGWAVTASRCGTRSGIPADLAVGARFARSRRDFGSVEDREHGRIGKIGPNVRDYLRRAQRTSGVHAVGEENYEHLALRVDPHRRASEAGVSVSSFAQVPAGTVVAFSSVPAECAVAER